MPASAIDELPARSRTAREAVQTQASTDQRRMAAAGTVGARWEYTITDLFTRARTRVALTVERIDGTNLIMNNGGRIEAPDGRLIELTQPVLGELDNSMPAIGWVRPDAQPGQTWALSYEPPGTPGRKMRLTAKVVANETLTTPAGTFDVVRVDYRGNMIETATRNQGRSAQAMPYTATIWYAPSLNRAVQMRATSMSTFNQINEQIQLTAMPGGPTSVSLPAADAGGLVSSSR